MDFKNLCASLFDVQKFALKNRWMETRLRSMLQNVSITKQIPFSYKQNVVMLTRITNDSGSFGHVTHLNLLSGEGSSCEGVSVAAVTSVVVVSSTCSESASIWKILVLFSVRQDQVSNLHLWPKSRLEMFERQCQTCDDFPLASRLGKHMDSTLLEHHDRLNMPPPPSSNGMLGYKQLIWAMGISGHARQAVY